MKGENRLYLNDKISMAEVAKLLKVSNQQISQVINDKTYLNFNDYVNTYPIKEAKRMLLTNTFSKLTIDAIAQKSDFSSKSSFYVAVKKHNVNTPKEFIAVCTNKILPNKLEKILAIRNTPQILPRIVYRWYLANVLKIKA